MRFVKCVQKMCIRFVYILIQKSVDIYTICVYNVNVHYLCTFTLKKR